MAPADEKVNDSRNCVTLRTERSLSALPLLRVVIGGFVSRRDLLVEQLDDLHLAVEALLAEESEGTGPLSLEVWADGRGISLRVDGLTNSSVKAALLAAEPFHPCVECLLDVRILLESLVDEFSVEEGTDGAFAVRMDKWT